MAFFDFHQNNSGGSFDHDPKRGIGYSVIIEAATPAEANERALAIGLYFDGCEQGLDCDCCGDRWYEQWESHSGTEQPEMYGKPPTGGWGIPSYIHYADGRVVVAGDRAQDA